MSHYASSVAFLWPFCRDLDSELSCLLLLLLFLSIVLSSYYYTVLTTDF
jgi:hypothetical protein